MQVRGLIRVPARMGVTPVTFGAMRIVDNRHTHENGFPFADLYFSIYVFSVDLRTRYGSIIMQQFADQKPDTFADRRSSDTDETQSQERRQFRDGNQSERSEVAELAAAVDQYKLQNRRRFITFEELYDVMAGLGYHK